MPVNIHGKMYWPVAERLGLAHSEQDDPLQSIITEPIRVFDDGGVTFRAVVTFQSGRTFTGHAYESPNSAAPDLILNTAAHESVGRRTINLVC